MPTKLKFLATLGASICLAPLLTPLSAAAITAEVAKKCGALADKAYPPRMPGNPAAGRSNGTAKDFRDYFNKCVANQGNATEQGNQKATQTPASGSGQGNQTPQQAK